MTPKVARAGQLVAVSSQDLGSHRVFLESVTRLDFDESGHWTPRYELVGGPGKPRAVPVNDFNSAALVGVLPGTTERLQLPKSLPDGMYRLVKQATIATPGVGRSNIEISTPLTIKSR